jgi:hypothetical protein
MFESCGVIPFGSSTVLLPRMHIKQYFMWAPAQRPVASNLACYAALYFLPPTVTLYYLHSS